MTEARWLACAAPWPMLDFLDGRASDRKFRLFACACGRLLWDRLTSPGSRRAVEAAERFADGRATAAELLKAGKGADAAARRARWAAVPAAARKTALGGPSPAAARATLDQVVKVLGKAGAHPPACALLRDLAGPLPFRPVVPDPAWLTSDAVALARGIYDERAFDRMPILADALQDAGCDDADVLTHCRAGAQPHARGCWVLDLVLGAM